MKAITRIIAIVLLTVLFSHNIIAQPRVKTETMLKINLTEHVSKNDSVYNSESLLRVVCVGTDNSGLIVQNIFHTYPGMPVFTGVEFTSLKVIVSSPNSDKTTEFYI